MVSVQVHTANFLGMLIKTVETGHEQITIRIGKREVCPAAFAAGDKDEVWSEIIGVIALPLRPDEELSDGIVHLNTIIPKNLPPEIL